MGWFKYFKYLNFLSIKKVGEDTLENKPFFWQYTFHTISTTHYPVLKVMYFILTLQVPLTLQSVFSKTDSLFLKEDTKKCLLTNTCPRACISQYTPVGVYWLVQALEYVLFNTHSWASAQRMNRILGLGSVSHSQTSPDKGFCQDAFD